MRTAEMAIPRCCCEMARSEERARVNVFMVYGWMSDTIYDSICNEIEVICFAVVVIRVKEEVIYFQFLINPTQSRKQFSSSFITVRNLSF